MPRDMTYDLFVSYARRDDVQQRITQLVSRVRADYRAFAGGKDLQVFFDTQEIQGMDDWRHRILGAVKQSRLLLACCSPAYLGSEYCAWECNEYVKHEAARALLGEGIAPIYFVDVPNWDGKDFDAGAAAWVVELRRRQFFDLRPWFDEGARALRRAVVKARMNELNRQLRGRLERIRSVFDATGNVDRHNENFVGRTEELRRLRELAGLGKVGVLTAVHGLGGVGKTALAIEYAHAFAHEYAGGRWQVRCEGRDDLRAALVSLAGARDLNFEFTAKEQKDPGAAFERVLGELKKRADASQPGRVLLILDNVDRAKLLEPAQVKHLPQADWLHLIATTRLGQKDLFGKQKDRAFLSVDELPDEVALALIERYQPEGKFRNADERAAATEIVRGLGRFTLSVETTAVFLGQSWRDVTCRAFLARLTKEGLTGSEGAARETSEGVRHGEKSLVATLRPTLEALSDPERLVLDVAALLPADHVALPWLRALAAERFPEFGRDAEPGYHDPWQSLIDRLLSLRLLQLTGVADPDQRPLVARMHRLVQEVVTRRDAFPADDLRRRITAHAEARGEVLQDNWLDWNNRWEMQPLTALSAQLLARGAAEGARLASRVAVGLLALARYAEAEPLFRQALALDEANHGPRHSHVAEDLGRLAALLLATNRLQEAEPLFQRVLKIDQAAYGPKDSRVATDLNSLAILLQQINRPKEAERLYRRALKIDEANHGPAHPKLAEALNNLAQLLQNTNRLKGAGALMRRVLAIHEASLGPEHPAITVGLCNLGRLLYFTDQFEEAEKLLRRALKIDETSLGPEHATVATDLQYLADLLHSTHRLEEAEPLLRRALQIGEATYGPDHPVVAGSLNSLGRILCSLRRLEEAEPLLRRALAIDEASRGPEHPNVARDVESLMELLLASNRFREAEPLMRRLVEDRLRFTVNTGQPHPGLEASRNNYIGLLRHMGRSQKQAMAKLRAVVRPFGVQPGG